jgi:hypothetical protein
MRYPTLDGTTSRVTAVKARLICGYLRDADSKVSHTARSNSRLLLPGSGGPVAHR